MDALIIVASADPDLRRLCRCELAKLGFDVLIAHNAWNTLRVAKAAKPDAVIVDSDVPGQHTYKLMYDLANSGVPVVLVPGIQERCLMELIPLADEFVRQVTVDNLASAVETIVARCARLNWRKERTGPIAVCESTGPGERSHTP